MIKILIKGLLGSVIVLLLDGFRAERCPSIGLISEYPILLHCVGAYPASQAIRHPLIKMWQVLVLH